MNNSWDIGDIINAPPPPISKEDYYQTMRNSISNADVIQEVIDLYHEIIENQEIPFADEMKPEWLKTLATIMEDHVEYFYVTDKMGKKRLKNPVAACVTAFLLGQEMADRNVWVEVPDWEREGD